MDECWPHGIIYQQCGKVGGEENPMLSLFTKNWNAANSFQHSWKNKSPAMNHHFEKVEPKQFRWLLCKYIHCSTVSNYCVVPLTCLIFFPRLIWLSIQSFSFHQEFLFRNMRQCLRIQPFYGVLICQSHHVQSSVGLVLKLMWQGAS